MKKWILIGAAVIALIGASIGGTLFLTGAFATTPHDDNQNATSEESNKNKELLYYNIQPEFVVNFKRPERPRVLMVEISISSHSEKAIFALDTHTPELRNNLLLLLSEQSGEDMKSVAGKNQLREKVKSTLNTLLEKHASKGSVEDVFFTRFVLQ